MQSTICILLIAIAASKCRAKVRIIQGNDISIEFDKPLEITFTNDKTSDVVFRHQHRLVAYCLGKNGCNIDDGRFNITQNTSAGRNEYILTSKDIIKPDLCGVHECNDLLSPEKDSANVSIIGFDNTTYNATEEKDSIYLTTACIFNVSLSDMQIVWYTHDNTTLKLLDENEMEASMTLFNSASVCSDECGTLFAYRFTFRLNITDQEQGYTYVFIETKIFHPDYKNKPLTWRSSETFRVKESSPKTPTSGVLLIVIALVSVCVTVSIAGAIYALIRALQIKRSKPRVCSRGKKAATPRPVETQPVGESDRDLRYISRKNKHHPRDSCIHSQSDEDISLCVEVLEDDTEIESDSDLQCILGENTHHLQDSCIHSQSDEDISLYEGQMVSIHTTKIESDRDLQCIVGVNTPLHLPDSCIHSQSDEDISLYERKMVSIHATEMVSDRDLQCNLGENTHHSWIYSQSDEDIPLYVEVLRDDTETDSDIDLVYIINKDYLRDSGKQSQSDEDIPLCVEVSGNDTL